MKSIKKLVYESLSPDNDQVRYTEISEEPTEFRYRNIWKRVHIRLRTALRISKMMKNLKMFNMNSLRQLKSEKDFNDLLDTADKLSKYSTKTYVPANLLPKFIFHPNQGFKVYWNMFLGLCLLYTATITPYVLAFVAIRDFDHWFFIDIFISCAFIIDLIITLNTAYQDFDGTLIALRSEIFKNYLRTWFFIDFFACIPFDLILCFISPNSQRASYNTLSKLMRLKNLPRLFRLSKLLIYFKDNKDFPVLDNIYYFFSFSTSIVKFLNTVFTILISLHIVSCLWYFTAKLDDFGPDTWIYRNNLLDSSVFECYIYSVYWALVTLSTTGYGDFYAKTLNERLLSIFWMTVALYFLSFSISSLSTMISEKDSGRRRQLDKKLALIDNFVKENGLSKKIKNQMVKVVKEISEKHLYSFSDKLKLLEQLTPRIRIKIAHRAHYGVLAMFEFLKSQDEKFVYSIVPLLKTINIEADKYLYKEGDPYKEIYFMIQGKAFYVTCTGIKFKVIGPGCYCGEYEVVNAIKRVFTIKIVEQSLFWVMGTELLKKIQQEFPAFLKDMKKNSAKRHDDVIFQLSEVKALQSINLSQITNLSYIRKEIEKEYKYLKLQYTLTQPEKNFLSRIDKKLDDCKKCIAENRKLLNSIQSSINSLTNLKLIN